MDKETKDIWMDKIIYSDNPPEINLDEKVNNALLTMCRARAKKSDWKDCNNCRLKFICWTYKDLNATKKA